MNRKTPCVILAAGLAFVACSDDDDDDVDNGTVVDDGTVGDSGSIPPAVTSVPAGTNPVVPGATAAP